MIAADQRTEFIVDSPGDPVPAELSALAQLAVKGHIHCFWSWDPEARIVTRDQVCQVIRYLRMYGGWKEWNLARQLQQCLSPRSSAGSFA